MRCGAFMADFLDIAIEMGWIDDDGNRVPDSVQYRERSKWPAEKKRDEHPPCDCGGMAHGTKGLHEEDCCAVTHRKMESRRT